MSFATLGYEVRPLFSAAEIGRLQQCVADHMQRVAGAMLKPQAETEPDAPFDERIERIAAQDHSFAQLLATAVGTDAQRAAVAQELAHDPRLTGMAADLAGCAIGDRLWRFRLNSPSLPASRQPWHSDVVRVTGPCSDVAITAWIPLGKIVGADAGLEVAAGRRNAPLPHEIVAGRIAIAPHHLADGAVHYPQVPAGHGLFLDPFTPQRDAAVIGPRSRWSLVVWLKRAA
ncbi:hypothetical protein GRI97_04945 [Altererythrobacter xixiisoli]|uniref:Phytanoyl-CoA dioxygenase n=1 Tax=Croceibacterium xixiisoli TaxID=1476466 RepID=A0A6I4TT14_9SPHN|nr:hypothetical protein [Croceibacterium xixiisoli]MXO98330.1 hypothetical protein [Croceibacterium xixiisoli]